MCQLPSDTGGSRKIAGPAGTWAAGSRGLVRSISRSSFVLAGLLVAGSVSAATADPGARRAFTIPDLYRLKGVADPRISPDGRRVAYSVRETDLPTGKSRTNIWIADLATGERTALTGRPTANASPRWSPDGRSIAFVSNRGGDDQVWIVPASGGRPAPRRPSFPRALPPVWAPDGSALALRRRRLSGVRRRRRVQSPDPRRPGGRTAPRPRRRPAALPSLDRVEGRTPDARRRRGRARAERRADVTPGRLRRAAVRHRRRVELRVLARRPGDLLRVEPRFRSRVLDELGPLGRARRAGRRGAGTSRPANRGYDGRPSYSPDGRFIAYVTQTTPGYESDRIRLALYDRRSGTVALDDGRLRQLGRGHRSGRGTRDRSSSRRRSQARSRSFASTSRSGAIARVGRTATIDRFDMTPDARRSVVAATIGFGAAALWTSRSSAPAR